MSEIIEKELSYLINGCVFDVPSEVGPGLREECYQKGTDSRHSALRVSGSDPVPTRAMRRLSRPPPTSGNPADSALR